MSRFHYGNDPAKINRYISFWKREEVKRPLAGFTLLGWFPVKEFAACRAWPSERYLTPEMVRPQDFLADHLRILKEGEFIEDDLLRGANPGQLAIPWLPGTLGCKIRILPSNIAGEEQNLSMEEALKVNFDRNNPWYNKYLEFAAVLAKASNGAFPISHGSEIGPTDLHAILRTQEESIFDLTDDPERSAVLLKKLADIFISFTEDFWEHIPKFQAGYFDAQYSLWSPGPIIRLQEDATAVYSPDLYKKYVQPVDKYIAGHFTNSFIHLHSTSMYLLDLLLDIEGLKCYEINNDIQGPALKDMIPYFKKVQSAKKLLLLKGSFTPEETRLLMDSLEPEGLFINVMIKDIKEVEVLKRIIGF